MNQVITKKRVIISLALVGVISIINLYLNYSFIIVSSSEDATALIKKDGEVVGEAKVTQNNNLRKFVKKGFYEVQATNDKKTYISSIKTEGKLNNHSVDISLKSEAKREFVGENPSSCFLYPYGQLLSYPCRSEIRNAQLYVPPTESIPGYNTKPYPLELIAEGFVRIGDSEYFIAKAPALNESFLPGHSAYELTPDFDIVRPVQLKGADPNTTYEVIQTSVGFVLFSPDSDPLYYTTVSSEPSRIGSIDKFEDFEMRDFGEFNGSFIVSYDDSELGRDEPIDLDNETDTKNVTTKILFINDNEETEITLNGYFAHLELCSQTRLCVLEGDRLLVYLKENGNLNKEFEYSGVQRISMFNDKLLATTASGVFEINPETGEGFIHFATNEQQLCGIESTKDGYLVCVIGQKNEKNILLIDPVKDVDDEIDKKIEALAGSPLIDDILIHKRNIYISPVYGERVLLPTGGLGYPQDRVDAVDAELADLVRQANIDLSKYLVQTTYLKRLSD